MLVYARNVCNFAIIQVKAGLIYAHAQMLSTKLLLPIVIKMDCSCQWLSTLGSIDG